MNQTQLRQMAQDRILDAAALLAGHRWSYAYYAAGYAVECGLKSCVLAQMIHTGGVFLNKKYAEWCWTHVFAELIDLAGMQAQLNAQLAANPAFRGYWGTVNLWKETSRYESKTQTEAEQLYEAITHNPDGVLRWIQNYW